MKRKSALEIGIYRERMDYFLRLYGVLPRAGPGDDVSTGRAFAMMAGLLPCPRILDVGCGPGMQTLELARLSGGKITGLDLLPSMLERVDKAVLEAGYSDRITTVQGDMNTMEFPGESFDVLWSEGGIYIMGFEKGLRVFSGFLKKGGYIAVSEPVWLKPDPPEDVLKFWEDYPDIDFPQNKVDVIENVGLQNVGHFMLPPKSWTKDYYEPLAVKVGEMEKAWKGHALGEKVLAEARTEIEVFKRYPDYFTYGFFVMKK